MSWILSHGDNTMLNLSDLLWWNSPFSQMPPLAFVLEHYMDGDIDGMQLAMQFVSSPIYFSLLCETAREKKSYSNTQLRSSQSCIWFDEVEKFVTVWNWHLRGEIIRRPKRGEAYTWLWLLDKNVKKHPRSLQVFPNGQKYQTQQVKFRA